VRKKNGNKKTQRRHFAVLSIARKRQLKAYDKNDFEFATLLNEAFEKLNDDSPKRKDERNIRLIDFDAMRESTVMQGAMEELEKYGKTLTKSTLNFYNEDT